MGFYATAASAVAPPAKAEPCPEVQDVSGRLVLRSSQSEAGSRQAKTDLPPKNRVRGSRRSFSTRTRFRPSEPVETQQETFDTSTTTVSGLTCWLSRDPIGERGGLDLYTYVGNEPIAHIDRLGLARMLTASLLGGKEQYDAIARRILRLLDELNKLKDSQGRECYRTYVKDLVATSTTEVKKYVDLFPEHVYLVAHGGLTVNGQSFRGSSYRWNKRDKVVEGIDIRYDGTLTPLSVFGPKLNMENVFGCFLSPEWRKRKIEGEPFAVFSQKGAIDGMYSDLYDRLLRYKNVTECSCIISILVYEGERSSSLDTRGTDFMLKNYPLKPEQEYTGDMYPDPDGDE